MDLINVTSDLFEYLVTFRKNVAQAAVSRVDVVRFELEACFATMEQKVAQNPKLAGEFKFIKYPLVVFADEIILTSSWPEAKKWEQFLLEKKFYGTNIGGNQFFKMLGQVEQMPQSVVTVFFYCLGFGFRGGFAQGDPSVARLKHRLWSRIQSKEIKQQGRLFEQAYKVETGEERGLKRTWNWSHLAIAAVMSFLILLTFERFVIWPMLIGLSVDVEQTAGETASSGERVAANSDQPGQGVAVAPSAPLGFTAQLGTFSNELLAKHFSSQMKQAGIETRLVLYSSDGNANQYLVLSKTFNDTASATSLLQKAKGASNLVTEMSVKTLAETRGQCLEGCL